MANILLIGQGFENSEIHLSAWLYTGDFVGDLRPVPELVEITSGPTMKRTALCFVVGRGWIRNCEKPGVSLPSRSYCPATCEPSCEEADRQTLETDGDRGMLPQNPNDREAQLYNLFQYLNNVAEELECPLCCKVEMSAAATTQHHDKPRSERQTRLQDQIGAGGELRFGFSFEGPIFLFTLHLRRRQHFLARLTDL
ncbi:hypothetical protein [Rhizobium sp. R86522]|uniref:hypothetical protein n=1 Tax=Rhizobium sp. R86522 TaxID=3093861 RepID=UPI0036707E65